MLDALSGAISWNQARVLIKPNLLLAARPEKAITTHPLIIKAVVEYVQRRGGQVHIFDSPAIGSMDKIETGGGYRAVLHDLGVKFKAFSSQVKVDIGEPFGRISMAREPFEADVVINLPKLKTHSQMLLTLGVKNMFGCVIGLEKPQWHLRSGVDRGLFARLLVQIYQAVQPPITLLDGILSLEGQGPGKRGTPRRLGVMVGGNNALAVDAAVCGMLGIEPDRLFTNRAAGQMGLLDFTIDLRGETIKAPGFILPVLGSLDMGPKPLHKFIRKHFLQKPVAERHLCKLCGECWKYCPAKAITPEDEKIRFDYDRCIRCYCCSEVCPHGALDIVEPFPGKLMRKLSGLR